MHYLFMIALTKMQGPICSESFISFHTHLLNKGSPSLELGSFESTTVKQSYELGKGLTAAYEVHKTSQSSYLYQLEQDVVALQQRLQDEINLNAVLKIALGLADGSLECFAASIPTHEHELLKDISELEADILNLEEQVIALRLQIGNEEAKQRDLEGSGQSASKGEKDAKPCSWNPLVDLGTTDSVSLYDVKKLSTSPVTPENFLHSSSTPISAKHEIELRELLSSLVPSAFDTPSSPGVPRKKLQARSLFDSPEHELADCLSSTELHSLLDPPSPHVRAQKVQPSSSFLSAEQELRECLSVFVCSGTDISDVSTSPVHMRNSVRSTSPVAFHERPAYSITPEHVRVQVGRRPASEDFSPSKSYLASRFSKHSSFDSFKEILFRSSSGSTLLASSSMSSDNLTSPSTPECGLFMSSEKEFYNSSSGNDNRELHHSPGSPDASPLQGSLRLSNVTQIQRQGSSWSSVAEDILSSQSSCIASPRIELEAHLLQPKNSSFEKLQQSSIYKTVMLKIRDRKLYKTAFFGKTRDPGSKKLRNFKADKHQSDLYRTPSSLSSNAKKFLSPPLSPSYGKANEEKVSDLRDCFLEPNRLSEEMVLCMIDIYRDLAEPRPARSKGTSLDDLFSFTPSLVQEDSQLNNDFELFSSSMIFHDAEKIFGTATSFDPYKTPEKLPWADIGRYNKAVEILGISIGKKKLDYAAEALQRYRLLLKQLSEIDPRCMTHVEKLAFWINLYNALVMHAYLAYGVPKNVLKFVSAIQKASYNVGGYSLNAFSIEYAMLRGKVTTRRPQLAWMLALHKIKLSDDEQQFAIDRPEPLINFALCCGARSCPAVRIYTAENVEAELQEALYDYIRSSVGVSIKGKLLVPKLLFNFFQDIVAESELLEWICLYLPSSQVTVIHECLSQKRHGILNTRTYSIVPFDFEFRYLFVSTY